MNKSRSEVVFGEFWRRGNDRPLWDGGEARRCGSPANDPADEVGGGGWRPKKTTTEEKGQHLRQNIRYEAGGCYLN
ncbi:hypothetical protein GWI33_003598 [Rhynchophorus ferrugineus]|uniref:Uncharacterized protein n=1 Tax=Rhynchophorus ferrugineus TaxID=354439 RepID=A0A834HKT8_RHYFE|nr:hypothetical protein GWI33_003598 [Rhynchophorus ferrugineus]